MSSKDDEHGKVDKESSRSNADTRCSKWLSVLRTLQSTDVIVLLTPLVVPVSQDPNDTSDPFECLGRALEARHPRIRHQPYTTRNGITSTHVGFIKRAKVVIFVINDAIVAGGATPHVDAAHVTQVLANGSPLILLLTSGSQDLLHLSDDFPTVVQSRDYTRPSLEMAAAIMFGEGDKVAPTTVFSPVPLPHQPGQPRVWPVEQWDQSLDINSVSDLWNRSMDRQFSMHATFLAALLDRPGWARHYIVRDPSRQFVLGFAATFLSYVDQAGEKLIASLAILLVRPDIQRQGIGLSLHNHALEQLRKTRGVGRLQLGSTFPRILYGPPYSDSFDHSWFSHRAWQTNRQQPGQGQAVYDMLLDFNDWQAADASLKSGAQFQPCTPEDIATVLKLVDRETAREHNVGWFDQYSRLVNTQHVKDIMVSLERNNIVGVALTYRPSEKSPISDDLPWAKQIGDDVGGVTCICVPLDKRDEIMVPLLDACVRTLKLKGMRRMFIDGITQHVDAFKQLGFKEWAKYRDVWRDI